MTRPVDDLPEMALSVRQPWAWAIIHARKDVENRSWQAMNHGLDFRGRVAIHASKGLTRSEYEDSAGFMRQMIGVECPAARDLLRGGIIGTVDVIDAVRSSDSKWFFGPRALVLRDPQPCAFHPVGGALGFFRWRSMPASSPPEPARWMMAAEPIAPDPPPLLGLFA